MRGGLSVLLVGLVLGCRPSPPPTRLDAFDPGPVPVEHREGEQLFSAHCASCHGLLAVGTDRGPPLVDRIYEPAHHADIAFERAVAFGVQPHHWGFGPMPAIKGVDRGGVAAITAYVRWLQRQAGIF